MGEESSRNVADQMEPFERLALGIDRPQAGVDVDPVERAEEPAACAQPVVRRLVEGDQAVGLLVEVVVVPGAGKLVVALDRARKRVGRDVELLGKLLERVRLLHEPGLLPLGDGVGQRFVLPVRGGSVGIGVMARASDGLELLHMLEIVRVPDSAPAVLGLVSGGVHDVVVGRRFVREPLSVQIHFEPCLRAEADLLLELGPAEPFRAGEGCFVGVHARSVEHHAGVGLVESAAHPQACFYPVPGGEPGRGVAGGHAGERLGLQGAQHVDVVLVSTRCEDDALRGCETDHAPVFFFRDGGGDRVVVVLEFDERGLVADIPSELLHVFGPHRRARPVGIVPDRTVAGGKLRMGGGIREVGRVAALEEQLSHRATFEKVCVPVDGLGALFKPDLHEALVDVVGGVHGEVVKARRRVGHVVLGLLQLGSDAPDVVAHHAGSARLLEGDRLKAHLEGGHGGHHPARARSDDEHFALDGLLRLADVRLLAQPVGRFRRSARRFVWIDGVRGVGSACGRAGSEESEGCGARRRCERPLQKAATCQFVSHDVPPCFTSVFRCGGHLLRCRALRPHDSPRFPCRHSCAVAARG